MLKRSLWFAAMTFLLAWTGVAISQAEEAAPDAVAAEATPLSATVTAGPLIIVRTFDGVFVADEMSPVEVAPEIFADLEVTRALPAGTAVSKGDPILWFDAELYEEQLAEVLVNHEIAEIEWARAEAEYEFKMVNFARSLDWARRAGRIAEEDYHRWVETTEAFRDQYLALDAKGEALGREMAAEELRQLKAMYEADELIEDTETIILKRNEYYAERAEVNYQVSDKQFAYRVEQDIPREREQVNRDREDAQIAIKRAELFTPMEMELAELRFGQAREAHEDALERHADFLADEAWLVVEAPADGVIYYGRCTQGQWHSGGLEDQLTEGGRIASGQTVMTIVSTGALSVRAQIGEGNLFEVDPGDAVYVTPTGYPRERLAGEVTELTIAPSLNQKYAIAASLTDVDARILPGMTCRISVVVADEPEALWLEATTVFTDEATGERFVYLADDGARRMVEVGYEQSGQLEILSGLAEGDSVLLNAPDQD